MNTFLIALSFLMLSATRGCSAEVETVNTTMNEDQDCSNPQLKEAVQEFNRNGNWTPVKTRLEDAMNHNSSAYRLFQLGRSYHYIGISGNTQLASLLLCNGLDVNATDYLGRTILHGAAMANQLPLVKLLLAHGTDVNKRNVFTDTPLHVAAHSDNLDVVKLLVKAGADTTLSNNTGFNAFRLSLLNANTKMSEYLEQFPQ